MLFLAGISVPSDFLQGMPEAEQALLFDGLPLEDDCTLSRDLIQRVTLTLKDPDAVQLNVTNFNEENHVVLVKLGSTQEEVLARVPIPAGTFTSILTRPRSIQSKFFNATNATLYHG